LAGFFVRGEKPPVWHQMPDQQRRTLPADFGWNKAKKGLVLLNARTAARRILKPEGRRVNAG
jgi:hypothetical protein